MVGGRVDTGFIIFPCQHLAGEFTHPRLVACELHGPLVCDPFSFMLDIILPIPLYTSHPQAIIDNPCFMLSLSMLFLRLPCLSNVLYQYNMSALLPTDGYCHITSVNLHSTRTYGELRVCTGIILLAGERDTDGSKKHAIFEKSRTRYRHAPKSD